MLKNAQYLSTPQNIVVFAVWNLDAFSQRSPRCHGIRGELNACWCCNSTGVVAPSSNNAIRGGTNHSSAQLELGFDTKKVSIMGSKLGLSSKVLGSSLIQFSKI